MSLYKNLAKILEEVSNITHLPPPEVNFHNYEIMLNSDIDLVWRLDKGQLIIDLKNDSNTYKYLVTYYNISSDTIFEGTTEFTIDDLSGLIEDLKSIV
jgi:hypothetical protein